jgi:hypothetical protein
MAHEKPAPTSHARIASHVPGRLRFKLHDQSRERKTMEQIGLKLRSLEGIRDVRLNPACASVTVHYDRDRHSMAGILGVLEDLDVVVESIAHLPSTGENGDSNGPGDHTPGFIDAINDLNARIRRTTGLPIDLKLALPLAFVGAGVWSIGRKGLMIESVPGWLFLWIAFDMFVKLHPVEQRKH